MKPLNWIHYLLILFTLVGVILRFYALGDEFMWDDEQVGLIAAIKSQHQSFYDGAMYFQEHPPLGRWVQGIPTLFTDSNYAVLSLLGPNFFAWRHVPFEVLKDTFVSMRIMNAIIGSLGVLFAFLIVRRLYGLTPALWTSAILSLSFDLIGYSRQSGLWKIYSFSFSIITLYFYLRYLDAYQKRDSYYKIFYLLCTIIALTFALGSRNFDPLFVLLTLLASQFLVNFGKKHLQENILFCVLALLSYAFIFFYLYPSEAQLFAREHLNVPSVSALFGFSFFEMIKNTLLRNSLLFSLGFLIIAGSLIVHLYMNRLRYTQDVVGTVLSELQKQGLRQVLFIYLFVTFFGIGFTRLGASPPYNTSLFAAIFLLAGAFICGTIKNRLLFALLLGILALNTWQLVDGFPYSVWQYSNLGLGEPFYGNYYDRTMTETVLRELEKLGNPPLMSNNVNVLLFYGGPAEILFLRNDVRCTEDYLEAAASSSYFVFLQGNNPSDQFICPLFSTHLSLHKEFRYKERIDGLYRIV